MIMLVFFKEVYYRLEIWHQDLNQKIKTRWSSMDVQPTSTGWSPIIPRMDTHHRKSSRRKCTTDLKFGRAGGLVGRVGGWAGGWSGWWVCRAGELSGKWVVRPVGGRAGGLSFLSVNMRLISPFFNLFNSVVLNCGKSPQFPNINWRKKLNSPVLDIVPNLIFLVTPPLRCLS